jgi:hypothetical protein
MLFKKSFVICLILCFSTLLALITEYAYGRWFSHDRYWKGTVQRVTWTQSQLVKNIFTKTELISGVRLEMEQIGEILQPLQNKILVEIDLDGVIIFSNRSDIFTRDEVIENFVLENNMQVTISGYLPPSWHSLFWRGWINNPKEWFSPKYDHITMPFLWFETVYMLLFLAIGHLMRARYLEKDVVNILNTMQKRLS